MVSVKLCIVISQFWGFEVLQEETAKFGANCGETAADVLVSFVVGGDVEWRGMAIIKIVEIGVEVGHAVDDETRQLSSCSLNRGLAVVEHSEIGGTEGSWLILLADESDLDVLWEKTELALDGVGNFLHGDGFTSLAGT